MPLISPTAVYALPFVTSNATSTSGPTLVAGIDWAGTIVGTACDISVWPTVRNPLLESRQLRQPGAVVPHAQSQPPVVRIEPPPPDPAIARARRLLIEDLSPEQRTSFEAHGHFTIEVRGQRYRIEPRRAQNVRLLDSAGRIERTYCAHPQDPMPVYDVMLAQKLLLETNPEEFFRLANVS